MNKHHGIRFLSCLVLSMVFFPTVVHANDYESSIRKCKDINNNEERLKCFDTIQIAVTKPETERKEIEKPAVQSSNTSPADVQGLEEVFCGSNKAYLRKDPFSSKDQKKLFDCTSDMKYYLIGWSGNPGYMWGHIKIYRNNIFFTEGWIENTELLTKDIWETRRAEIEQFQQEDEKIRQEKETIIRKKEALIQLQPLNIQNAIRKERIILGMTKEAVRLSWGEPNDINRTVSPGQVHEQWVYGRGTYLYFENGIVTSFQD